MPEEMLEDMIRSMIEMHDGTYQNTSETEDKVR